MRDDWQQAAELVDNAADEWPRLSPAARRFVAGEMDDEEARRLGYVRDDR